MSLITSCPNCGTMFRVVPDQLKISEGWVRCGHCSEIFDATAHLSDESILVEPAMAEHAQRPPEPPEQPALPSAGELLTRPAALDDLPGDRPTVPADLQTRPASLEEQTRPASLEDDWPSSLGPTPSQLPPDSKFNGDVQALEPSPLDAPFVFRPSDHVVGTGGDSELPREGRASQFAPEEPEEPTAAELGDVSFVRQARRKAFWRRPTVRIGLALVSLALAALLVLQVAYQDRHRIAHAEPALRPALAQMCEVLGCTLGPPRQIESIVIESSGFNRLRNDTYRLSFTLRNGARIPVAVPSMELTITDSQDQAIARRVLTPAELGAGDAIAPSGEWARSIGLALDTGGAARVAGYRLLAFYP